MNGPEHYREAERLLNVAARWESNIVDDTDTAAMAQIANTRAEAQVHATLALAAATAYAAVKDYTGDEDGSVSRGWAGVA